MFKYKSKINYANPQTKSMKVGLPKGIVQALNVQAGDTMEWSVEVEDDNITVKCKKAE